MNLVLGKKWCSIIRKIKGMYRGLTTIVFLEINISCYKMILYSKNKEEIFLLIFMQS